MEKTLEIKRKAQRFVQNGDLDRAVQEYQKLLAADESDPYTHVTLGDLYFKKGTLDEAGRRYQEAADAYHRAGLIKNAIAVCKKMLRLNLRASDVLKALAELHAQDGLSTDAALYYVQYADLLLGKDLRAQAAESLELASRLVPDEPRHAERLGELWGLEGESLKASRALHRAARAYETRGQMAEAAVCRDRAEELYPGAGALPDEAGTAASSTSPANGAPGAPGPSGPSGPSGPTAVPAATASSREGSDPSIARNGRFVPPSTFAREGIESTRIGGAGMHAPPSGAMAVAQAPAEPVVARPVLDPRGVQTSLPTEVSEVLATARALLAAGERERAAELLLGAAQTLESLGGLDQAASIYQELSRSPQASERLYRLWLSNCERREQWSEAAGVCCELGDLALAAQEPASAHEWFVQARAYDPTSDTAGRRLERLADWGKRPEAQIRADRVTVQQRMPEDFDVDLGELLNAFQQGVREQVQADDSASHYDLGMTYRQMGLLDEAVAEFRMAARDPAFSVKCTDMLGRCLLERGDFGSAIAEFERGLALPGLPPEVAYSFHFSLGLVLEASGRPMEALEQFEAVFAAQPNYPDVAAKIRELRR